MHNLARFVSSHVLYLHMIWSLNYVLQISITYSGFFVHTWRICGQLCEVISLCSLYIEVAPFCIFFWQCSVCIRFFVFSWWCFVWIRWSWRKTPVALCVTESRCFVKRSLESSVRPRYRMEGLQGEDWVVQFPGSGVYSSSSNGVAVFSECAAHSSSTCSARFATNSWKLLFGVRPPLLSRSFRLPFKWRQRFSSSSRRQVTRNVYVKLVGIILFTIYLYKKCNV